jgi:transposase
MSKQIVALGKPAISSEQYPHPQVKKLFCGIDVGAETLAVAVLEPDRPSV